MQQQVPTIRTRSRYGSHGGHGLATRIEFELNTPAAAQLGLYQELALYRTLLQDNVTHYEIICAATDDDPKDSKTAAMRHRLQQRIEEQLVNIAKVARAASQVELSIAIRPDKLADLAASVIEAINQNADGQNREAICGAVLNAFQQTSLGSQQSGRSTVAILSPHETVKQMDDSIPFVEDGADIGAQRMAETANGLVSVPDTVPEWNSYTELESFEE